MVLFIASETVCWLKLVFSFWRFVLMKSLESKWLWIVIGDVKSDNDPTYHHNLILKVFMPKN